jgi:phospholipid transport system transporter-binding protein
LNGETMKLPPQATLEQAAALAQALPAAVADGNGVLRIDASDLRSFDSSAIALLMQARRMAQAAGRGFEVAGAPAKLAELARLYGVEELLALRSGTPAA